ncbi:septal ring lytic transglycosylase RlpA family protein [Robbsia sp. Bb-Pol-6]|uniref:Endolytic peptidoglycan transglycosylase RlpA n=1 Tax=Robbsia betulipollinis TaxID=2981849 RepID=A0ABT3ZT23_9BURK|nr:septal ring lytic transglycosylase RlpA family protein [Robbsia betulipollinis]MCY0389716.1 septal ring lytic transglycosylase RlpA family protein [Robbsia betulipollinis]
MNARFFRRFAVVFATLSVAGCALPPPSTDSLSQSGQSDDNLSTNHAQIVASDTGDAAHRKATLRQSIAGLLHPSLTLARVCMRATHQDRAACNSPEAQASAAALLAAAGEPHPAAGNDADTLNADARNGRADEQRSASVSDKAPDVSDFRQAGSASWYGNGFHGRKTASGERYDMNEMTAAHRFLPLFSYVRVTNALNHRSVVVKINDRGPFHSRRILDLSYAAAQALGMGHRGTEQVSIKGLSANEARAAFAATVLASQ